MITNERQYQISKAQVAKFRAAIEAPDSSTRTLHPRAQKALREAAQSQLDDLAAEVADYERLRDGQLTAITAESIADLARVFDALRARGYADADVTSIAHGNFLRCLRNAWPTP